MDNTEQKSSIANRIFYVIVFILVAISIGVTFYNIVVLKDYQIIAEVSCDPTSEECFVFICDPITDDTCPTNPDEQTTYYKNISKKAASIFLCEQTVEKIGCGEELSCISDEQLCSYTYCDPDNLAEGEQCSE